MDRLTKKQQLIFSFIKRFIKINGYSPTIDEIRRDFGLKALSGAHQHVNALIEKGLLSRQGNGARCLDVKRITTDKIEVPLIGKITAGQPIEAIEDRKEIINLNKDDITGSGKLFALKVVGNSMIGEGIFDGDTVILKQQATFEDGQTVVAIIDENEATLKKIYREKGRFRLQPANAELFPIYRKEVEVRGVVVKVVRDYIKTQNAVSKKEVIFKMAELFCGPGGLAHGALTAFAYNQKGERYGVQPVWANDIDSATCKTYARNVHAGDASCVTCGSVENIDFKKVKKFDALAFGFPCNDFSIIGEHKGFDGKYGPLYTYGVKAINIHNPKWFIAENVSGLQSANEGKAFRKILSGLQNAGNGYKVTVHLYKFEEYGVPQYRHRVVIVGIRRDLGLEFKVPAPTTKEDHLTVREAFENPPIQSSAPNNEITKQAKIVIERLKNIPPGKNVWYEGLPRHLRLNVKGAKMSQIYKRLDPNRPSYTITGSGGGGTHGYHWEYPRALTNRERARIQTFPDDFVFEGSKEEVRKQIGMAVPPRAAKVVIEAILKTFAGVPYKWIEPTINILG
jgi:DNA (cytosine-5)-methyltransferase 1